MGITRKVVEKPKKRDRAELIKKHEKIGGLLGLKPVPTHTLAWKEDRLELDTGDCYPIVDVLERIAELMGQMAVNRKPAQGAGSSSKPQPKKAK